MQYVHVPGPSPPPPPPPIHLKGSGPGYEATLDLKQSSCMQYVCGDVLERTVGYNIIERIPVCI
jgi:hypothetical protein